MDCFYTFLIWVRAGHSAVVKLILVRLEMAVICYLNFLSGVLVELVVYDGMQAHLLQFLDSIPIIVVIAPAEYN